MKLGLALGLFLGWINATVHAYLKITVWGTRLLSVFLDTSDVEVEEKSKGTLCDLVMACI